MTLQSGIEPVCYNRRLIGLDMHTWKRHSDYPGTAIQNISLSGFGSDTACYSAFSIHVDSQTLKQGQFDFFSTFEKMNLQADAHTISFCDAENKDIDTVYYTDLDGSLSPSGVTSTNPSTILSNGASVQAFVDESKCTVDANGCYSYCSDTCFRSVRYQTMTTEMDDYALKACLWNSTTCTMFKGSRRSLNDYREFIAHLPVGNEYDLVFVNVIGEEVPPASDLTEIYEDNTCLSFAIFYVNLG